MKYRIIKKDGKKWGLLNNKFEDNLKFNPDPVNTNYDDPMEYYELITDVHNIRPLGKIPVVEYYRSRENAEKRIKELKSEDK